jgi:glycosyltransferase involved in cell wall biosynthesis
MSPHVSVVIPTWNGARTIEAAARSILSQNYRDLELLIVDDGSTDNTLELVWRLAAEDSRVKIIAIPHSGLAAAPNAALAVARGKYTAMMDHDDVSLPARLEKQVAYLDSHPRCVAVGSAYFEIDTRKSTKIRRRGRKSYPWAPTAFPPLTPHPMHPTVMVRTDAIRAVGGYREEFDFFCCDADMFLRLREIGEFADVDEPLFEYYRHAGNATNSRREGGRIVACLVILSAVARHHHLDERQALALARSGEHEAALQEYARIIGDRYPALLLRDVLDITGSAGRGATLGGAARLVFAGLASSPTDRNRWLMLTKLIKRCKGAVRKTLRSKASPQTVPAP